LGCLGFPVGLIPKIVTCSHFRAACNEPVTERFSCQHLFHPKVRKNWALRIKSAMGTTFFHYSHSTHFDQVYGPSHLTCISPRSQLLSFRFLSLRLQPSDVGAKNLTSHLSQLLSPTQLLQNLPPPQPQLQSSLWYQHLSSPPQPQLHLNPRHRVANTPCHPFDPQHPQVPSVSPPRPTAPLLAQPSAPPPLSLQSAPLSPSAPSAPPLSLQLSQSPRLTFNTNLLLRSLRLAQSPSQPLARTYTTPLLRLAQSLSPAPERMSTRQLPSSAQSPSPLQLRPSSRLVPSLFPDPVRLRLAPLPALSQPTRPSPTLAPSLRPALSPSTQSHGKLKEIELFERLCSDNGSSLKNFRKLSILPIPVLHISG
jgi:hypothetical protein